MRAALRRMFYGERAGTSSDAGLSDRLAYQSLVADGVVLLKDALGVRDAGALLAGWWYRGPDVESASEDALSNLSSAVNNALKKLDAGWVVHVEAIRVARRMYRGGDFAEAVDQLIDNERAVRAHHYVTEYALFLTRTSSALERATSQGLVSRLFGEKPEQELERLEARIAQFEATIEDFEQALALGVSVHRMRSTAQNDELLQALSVIVNGRMHPVRAPRGGSDLDSLLARDLLWDASLRDPGFMRHAGTYVEIVAIADLPAHSVPSLLHALTQVDAEIRWSSRFILMDYGGSRSALKTIEAKYTHKLLPLSSHLFGTQGAIDRDAAERLDEVQEALADLESGAVRYGHYTSVVVVRASTHDQAAKKAARVIALLEERGFSAMLETENRMEAFLGSLPGHRFENVRKPLVHTLNLADMLPLGREWEGDRHCPSPMFPPMSGALMQARSWSGSPFHLNLHVDDLGHTVILGPPGAGKSTLLAHLASQWMRYRRSKVVVFDQGCSMAALTLARRNGAFFRVGAPDGPQLCPMAELESPADIAWAADFIESLCDAQGEEVTPELRTQIFDAVTELQASTVHFEDRASKRTLTHLEPHFNSSVLSRALKYYTTGPGAAILNGQGSSLRDADFVCFELEELLGYDEKVVMPTILYLLREVERGNGVDTPRAIFMDEVWHLLGKPLFAQRLKSFLKKFRKQNCAVVLATQQLSDIVNSPICDVVFESCPTRILLPNEQATGSMRRLYAEYLRLSDAQIELLTRIERKRWYMLSQGTRSRLFTLDVGPVARAFCGASGPQELNRIWQLVAEHGEQWPQRWLYERGLPKEAARFEALAAERLSSRVHHRALKGGR